MEATGTDLELINLLDFDPVLQCEWRVLDGNQCSDMATWHLRFSCGCHKVFCPAHRTQIEEMAMAGRIYCTGHHVERGEMFIAGREKLR
jgi:hypothetical protein